MDRVWALGRGLGKGSVVPMDRVLASRQGGPGQGSVVPMDRVGAPGRARLS